MRVLSSTTGLCIYRNINWISNVWINSGFFCRDIWASTLPRKRKDGNGTMRPMLEGICLKWSSESCQSIHGCIPVSKSSQFAKILSCFCWCFPRLEWNYNATCSEWQKCTLVLHPKGGWVRGHDKPIHGGCDSCSFPGGVSGFCLRIWVFPKK